MVVSISNLKELFAESLALLHNPSMIAIVARVEPIIGGLTTSSPAQFSKQETNKSCQLVFQACSVFSWVFRNDGDDHPLQSFLFLRILLEKSPYIDWCKKDNYFIFTYWYFMINIESSSFCKLIVSWTETSQNKI